MKILVLGGTVFVGRSFVEAAKHRGHTLTIFHRGNHPSNLGVECIRGDRNTDMARLRERRWDAVVDTCGYHPSTVNVAVDALARSCGQYVFISTVSAYADFSPEGTDETAPLGTIDDDRVAALENPLDSAVGTMSAALGLAYGPLKARCERVVEKAFGERALIVRPGIIAGPFDPGGRLAYWALRVARSREVLAPGKPTRDVRVIDARDLSEWIVSCLERGTGGIFNAAGDTTAATMEHLLRIASHAARSTPQLTWVDEAFLLERGVEPWSELPLWLPESDNAIFRVKDDRALMAGLKYRPLFETIEDTLAWHRTPKGASAPSGFLTLERERTLLTEWRAYCQP